MFKWMSSLSGVVPVAACDVRPELWNAPTGGAVAEGKSMAEQMPDVVYYESYDDMLAKANLDIVMVETPATCHTEFCVKALEHGAHVYSDIPTVASVEEAELIWKVDAETPGMFMTGATTCGWGYVIGMQDLFAQGVLGKPYALEAEYIHDCRYLWDETPWRRPSVKWGSMPIRYCTHSLGPMLSIMDEEVRTVSCITTGSHVTDNPFCNDYMSALFQTPSGVSLRFTASFVNNAGCGHHSYRVFATKGYFEHLSSRGEEQPARTIYNTTENGKKLMTLPVDTSPYSTERGKQFEDLGSSFGHGGADSYLMQCFIAALERGDKVAPVSLKQGLAMTLPGIYAGQSAMQGGEKVTISYPWDK